MHSEKRQNSSTKAEEGKELPLNVPLVACFTYMSDCRVKLPVAARVKDGKYFIKTPIKPDPKWQMDVIIRGISFVPRHRIALILDPFGETDIWRSEIIECTANSPSAQIYEIAKPLHKAIASGRQGSRVMCMKTVRCQIANSKNLVRGICLDISPLGMAVRFRNELNIQVGDPLKILFEPPLEGLPQLVGKIVRQSSDVLDDTLTIGVIFNPDSRANAAKMAMFFARRLAFGDTSWAKPTAEKISSPANIQELQKKVQIPIADNLGFNNIGGGLFESHGMPQPPLGEGLREFRQA